MYISNVKLIRNMFRHDWQYRIWLRNVKTNLLYITLLLLFFSLFYSLLSCRHKEPLPEIKPQVYKVIVDSVGKDKKLYRVVRPSNDSLSVYAQKQFDAIRDHNNDSFLHYARLWYKFLKRGRWYDDPFFYTHNW